MNYLTAVLIFACISSLPTTRAEGQYGQICSSNQPCEDSSLQCQDGLCRCIYPESMVVENGKCVVLIGKTCIFRIFDRGFECVKNAWCNFQSGKCECNFEYEYPSKDLKHCLPKKPHHATCNESQECKGQLTCKNNSCVCPDKDQYYFEKANVPSEYYDVEPDSCVSRVGKPCNITAGLNCVKGATCTEAGICDCDSNHVRRSDGLCGRSFGQQCLNSGEPCSDHLVCYKKKCQCPNPNYQVGLDGEFDCRKLAFVPCVKNEDCTPGAECIKKNGTEGNSICQCRKGYIMGEDYNCYLEYGELCKEDVKYPHERCDPIANLVCKGGTCGCENKVDHYLDQRGIRRCYTPAGYPCTRFAGNGDDCLPSEMCHSDSENDSIGSCGPRINYAG